MTPSDGGRKARDPAVTQRIMRAVRSKDTKPEMILRRAIHAQGVRYRVHPRDVLGSPDIAVRSRKVAVFVDGDMWHGNPKEWERRGHPSMAEMFPTRTEWWVAKIERNVQRDREVTRGLEVAGWRVLRLWASDVLADPVGTANLVVRALKGTS